MPRWLQSLLNYWNYGSTTVPEPRAPSIVLNHNTFDIAHRLAEQIAAAIGLSGLNGIVAIVSYSPTMPACVAHQRGVGMLPPEDIREWLSLSYSRAMTAALSGAPTSHGGLHLEQVTVFGGTSHGVRIGIGFAGSGTDEQHRQFVSELRRVLISLAREQRDRVLDGTGL